MCYAAIFFFCKVSYSRNIGIAFCGFSSFFPSILGFIFCSEVLFGFSCIHLRNFRAVDSATHMNVCPPNPL